MFRPEFWPVHHTEFWSKHVALQVIYIYIYIYIYIERDQYPAVVLMVTVHSLTESCYHHMNDCLFPHSSAAYAFILLPFATVMCALSRAQFSNPIINPYNYTVMYCLCLLFEPYCDVLWFLFGQKLSFNQELCRITVFNLVSAKAKPGSTSQNCTVIFLY